MCRLVAYLGESILLDNVVTKPNNSIIQQSLHSREMNEPTNGDGFGLGWYTPHISPKPALFTSISPAWNDRNLLHLTARIESPAFFAHVRSATMGGVTQYNCHPFTHGQWMMMHNGWIYNFSKIKRHLRHLLDDDIYNWIKGESDTEHFFALFLQLSKGVSLDTLSNVADVLQATFEKIEELLSQHGGSGDSHYNICLTDGHRLIATRYSTDKAVMPESLHYTLIDKFIGHKKDNHEKKQEQVASGVLISSEKLTNHEKYWQDVPPQNMLLVHDNYEIEYRAL